MEHVQDDSATNNTKSGWRRRIPILLLFIVFFVISPFILPLIDFASVLAVSKPIFAGKSDAFYDGGSRQHEGMYYAIWDGRHSYDQRRNFINLKLIGFEVVRIQKSSRVQPPNSPSYPGAPSHPF